MFLTLLLLSGAASIISAKPILGDSFFTEDPSLLSEGSDSLIAFGIQPSPEEQFYLPKDSTSAPLLFDTSNSANLDGTFLSLAPLDSNGVPSGFETPPIDNFFPLYDDSTGSTYDPLLAAYNTDEQYPLDDPLGYLIASSSERTIPLCCYGIEVQAERNVNNEIIQVMNVEDCQRVASVNAVACNAMRKRPYKCELAGGTDEVKLLGQDCEKVTK